MITKAGTALLISALLAGGKCSATETHPDECKVHGLWVVTRADEAVRVGYAIWRSLSRDENGPKYDELWFAKNFSAHQQGCKWLVVQNGEHGIVILTINAKDGALLDLGSIE